jgi:type VI secretion system protein VasG
MMRGIASMLESHHKVQVLDEGIEAAVTLSARYIPARQLPDKSVSLMDTACARVAVSQHAVPAQVDDCQRRIEALNTEIDIIGRDETAGYDVGERRANVEAKIESENVRLTALTKKLGH